MCEGAKWEVGIGRRLGSGKMTRLLWIPSPPIPSPSPSPTDASEFESERGKGGGCLMAGTIVRGWRLYSKRVWVAGYMSSERVPV
jgi:hypothetical protein